MSGYEAQRICAELPRTLGQFADLKLSRLAVCNKSPLVALIDLTQKARAVLRRESQPNSNNIFIEGASPCSAKYFLPNVKIKELKNVPLADANLNRSKIAG